MVATCPMIQINLLVSQDHSFNARPKQDYRTYILLQKVKDLKVTGGVY